MALAVMFVPVVSSALTVTRSASHLTSDVDSHADEDAGRSGAYIGVNSTVSSVGASTGNMGYSFTGHAEAKVGQTISQTINGTVTWTVAAEDWEEYSINFTPTFNAYLNVVDNLADSTADTVSFSTLLATLRVNGGTVSDSLDMSGLTRTTNGDSNLGRTDFQALSGYTGNNTFSLQYTATLLVTAGGGLTTYTANAGLWGMDGTLGSELGVPADFDEYGYGTSGTAAADGLSVDATITLESVPEPASALMLAVGAGLIGLIRRFYRK